MKPPKLLDSFLKYLFSFIIVIACAFGQSSNTSIKPAAAPDKIAAAAPSKIAAAPAIASKVETTPVYTEQSVGRQMKMIVVLKDDIAWKDGAYINALPHPKSMKSSDAIANYNSTPAGKNYRIAALDEKSAPAPLRHAIDKFKNGLDPDLREKTAFTMIVRDGSQKVASADAPAKPGGQE